MIEINKVNLQLFTPFLNLMIFAIHMNKRKKNIYTTMKRRKMAGKTKFKNLF